jgi:hypothetical protein
MQPTQQPSASSLLRYSPLPQFGDAVVYGALAVGGVLLVIAFWFVAVPAWSSLKPIADMGATGQRSIEQIVVSQ